MSTRCIVEIKDYWMCDDKKVEKELTLYHHYDGYPSGVGKFLIEKIYPDLTRRNNIDGEIIANKLIKDKDDNGYEITYYTHSDIEYKYVIDVPARSIYCYKGYYPYNRSSNELSEFQVSEEIDLNDFIPRGVKGNYA